MRSSRSVSLRASSAWATCWPGREGHRNVDNEKAEKLANKLKKGKGFDLEDLHDQLQQVKKWAAWAR